MSQPPNQPSNPSNWTPFNFSNSTNTNSTYGGTYNPNIINSSMTPFPFGPYGRVPKQMPWQKNSDDSHQKQFSEWEFSGDEIVGLRSWRLFNGLLFPMHSGSDKPWSTGINQGHHYDWGWILQERKITDNNSMVELFCGGWVDNPICEDFHQCVCGFYAYWDGSDDYKLINEDPLLESDPDYIAHQPETLTGIIRAFGKVVVGSRGFRASKARLEALAVPTGVVLDSSYASIPQFKTVDKMLSEYPLTKVKGKDDN